jgi:hypothetical protein
MFESVPTSRTGAGPNSDTATAHLTIFIVIIFVMAPTRSTAM